MGSIISLKAAGVDFSKEVEDKVKKDKITFIEAILECCEKHGIEPESSAKLLSKPIKERIEMEAIEFNLRSSKKTLPLEK